MLRPGFPKLSHPSLAHAISSIAFIAQVYRGAKPVVSPTTSEGKVTDQQRPAQAPSGGQRSVPHDKRGATYPQGCIALGAVQLDSTI